MRKVLIAFKMILLIVISTSVMYADDIPPTNSIPMDKVISNIYAKGYDGINKIELTK